MSEFAATINKNSHTPLASWMSLFLCWKNSMSGKSDGVVGGLNWSTRALRGVYE